MAWAVALAVAAIGTDARPAQALAVAGSCLLTMTLQSGPTVEPVQGPPTWTVDGSGWCVVPGHLDPPSGTLSGTLVGVDDVPGGCAAGVYLGNLTFSAEPALEETSSTVVVAVMAGAALEITMAGTEPRLFVGSGAFVQTSTQEVLDCVPSGTSSTTWKGAFAFGEVDGSGPAPTAGTGSPR